MLAVGCLSLPPRFISFHISHLSLHNRHIVLRSPRLNEIRGAYLSSCNTLSKNPESFGVSWNWILGLLEQIGAIKMTQTKTDYATICSQRVDILQNCLSILSGAEPHHTQPRDQSSYMGATKEVRKQTRMSDALALLLIYESSDFAAVSFLQEKDHLSFYWVKNGLTEPTESEKAYLDGICSAFTSQKPTSAILDAYVAQCRL